MQIVKRGSGNPPRSGSERPREMTADEMTREHERLRREAWAASNRAAAIGGERGERGESTERAHE